MNSESTPPDQASAKIAEPSDIVTFWREAGPKAWFKKDENFDAEIRRRFLHSHEAAVGGELTGWEGNAEGALALLILLDQFPRNMFRGSARMFASDPQARSIAAGSITRGFDAEVAKTMRGFFYLPFMHSENLDDQLRAVAFYKAIDDADGLKWAEEHAGIVRRFGRFPHRNAVLGRATSPEEQTFLEAGGFSG